MPGRRLRAWIAAGVFLAAVTAASAIAQTEPAPLIADTIEGRWINPSRSVIILISPCGERYCGTVEWASEKAQDDARKGTDQLIGARLLRDVRNIRDDRWEGELFVPDMNKLVHAKIRLLGDRELKVSGCAVGKSLCRSQLWTRVQDSS